MLKQNWLLSVLYFLVTFTIVSLPLITALKTQGFSSEELIELANFDLNVDIPFSELNVSIILISFLVPLLTEVWLFVVLLTKYIRRTQI